MGSTDIAIVSWLITQPRGKFSYPTRNFATLGFYLHLSLDGMDYIILTSLVGPTFSL